MITPNNVSFLIDLSVDAVQALVRIADALEDQNAPPPQEGRTETCEAEYDAGTVDRLEEIRAEWADINDISTAAYENSPATIRGVRWLLSEIDRLRGIEEAARDYFDAKGDLDKRENMWPDGSPTASAYNKYARSRNRLEAKLEGEDD